MPYQRNRIVSKGGVQRDDVHLGFDASLHKWFKAVITATYVVAIPRYWPAQ